MTISVLVDIFYLPNSGYFDKRGVFQQPQAFTLIEIGRRWSMSEMGFDRFSRTGVLLESGPHRLP